MTSSLSRTAICLLASVLCLLATTACRKSPDAAPDPNAATPTPAKTLRLSQRNEPATLDPHLATLPDEFFIIRALNEGLVTPNPEGGDPLPGIAESWTTSTDGRTWTFQLRANARWSDGSPITAPQIVASFQRALAPAMAAPKAQMFFAVRDAVAFNQGEISDESALGFAAPDAHTVVITLERPTPDFLALVASGPWIPVPPSASAGATLRDAAWTRPGRNIGSGPFVLREWSPSRHILVTRNPHYWNADAVKLDAIRFIAFDNGDAEERAYRAGQLDVTMAVPASKLDGYRADRPQELHTVPLHETRYLALNLRRPPLDRREVRAALSLALDRSVLTNQLLKGGQRPALSYVPPGLGGYHPATTLQPDVARARELLAAAGFPGGKGFPTLEFSSWGVSPVILEAIQHQWRTALGIEVSIVQREARTHLASLAAGDYEIGFITAIPDYDSAFDLFADLMTDGAGNYPRWSHQEYDRLVTSAQAERDAALRLRTFHEAEALLLHELPLIPVYFNSQNFLIRPEVQGWHADALWTRFYLNVHLHEK